MDVYGAWIGAVAALLGAIIGGALTGWFTLRAQKQAAKDQRQRDVEAERRAITGTLQAIAAELRVLKTRNFDVLGSTLKDRADIRSQSGRNDFPPPLAMSYTEPNRLAVFESNAGILGKLEDAKLREQVIWVYELVRCVIDSLNADSREFVHWRSLPESSPEKRAVGDMLLRLEGSILIELADLQRESDELLRMIDEYLRS